MKEAGLFVQGCQTKCGISISISWVRLGYNGRHRRWNGGMEGRYGTLLHPLIKWCRGHSEGSAGESRGKASSSVYVEMNLKSFVGIVKSKS